MAGIGFQLKKMIEKDNGLLHMIKSYGLAILALNGPIILCILSVSVIGFLLKKPDYSGIPRDQILVTLTYSFVVSSVVTGAYSLILTRYVSDCIYKREDSKVMASFYGGIIPALVFNLVISMVLIFWGGLDIQYGLVIMILLSIISIIWIEMIYLSAVNDNISISVGFLLGNFFIVILLVFLKFIPEEYQLMYIFFCFITGFTITAVILMLQIKITFKGDWDNYFEWVTYIKTYPSLCLTGLFYTMGLYFPSIYYRFTSDNFMSNGFLTMQKKFDFPFYFAVLTIIPGMVFLL